MGKPTGFLEYPRTRAAHCPAAARVKDYDEFVLPQGEEALRTQAARCMDCGVPFCHAGFVVEGLPIGCPLSGLIPEINDLVYRGDLPAAYLRLAKTHPFPEITGRVCPALCEGSCTLGEHESPVAIRELERHVADTALAKGLAPRVPARRTGRRVAVVGSGPAGLACADMLNQLGNEVTVFEREDRPGGLLMYGIPNMKLDKSLVLARAALLEAEGVHFVLGTEIGQDTPAHRLMREFDAVVLCAGATSQRTLTAPGHGLRGVVTAMEYLTGSTRSLLGGGPPGALSAQGRDVVVVGGGDTGTDCVATALRQGARSIAQLEIMPCPPRHRAEGNPWPLWPKTHTTGYGHEEAAALFGADPREWSTTLQEVVDDGQGRVGGVKTVQVEWVAENGRPAPQELPGTQRLRPAGLVITAMGFTGPETTLIDRFGLAAAPGGCVQTAENSHLTSLATVFAAGDMRRGPSLVVWAIWEGRRAARECHQFLSGRPG